jgi:hypothetical protein
LPDAILTYQISQFWYILEGLGVKIVGIFMAISRTLSLFVNFSEHFVYFFPFWYMSNEEKSGNPGYYGWVGG